LAAKIINENVRYEPDEVPPAPIAIGAGIQSAMVIVAPVVLTIVIVSRIADQPDGFLSWAVFAALLICGITTVIQAVRVGPIGAGHILIMGTSGAFIAVCVAALVEGGPALMASLIVVSSLIQFLLASRLALLRRIFTPVIAGTVIMLIAVTVMPLVFDAVGDVPEGSPAEAAPITALVTLGVIALMILRAPPALRLWSPIIGIAIGCAVAGFFGIYDADRILDAAWVGVPLGSWPGFDFSLGQEFWVLLPAFVVVTLVGAIETLGDGVAIQRVSQRRTRATDFRVVQGALNADGLGNLLSGLAGTLPNTTYSTSISLADVTGIGARRVGVVIGVTLALVAFLPKVAAVLIAIPNPVAAAYLIVLIGLLFVQGMRIVVHDGVDHRKTIVVGVSFWLAVGFQNGVIFPEHLGDGFLAALFGNGMTAGAIVAIMMMLFIELTGSRSRRLRTNLDESCLPELEKFLRRFADRGGWDQRAAERLISAGEETLAILLQSAEQAGDEARRLTVAGRMDGQRAEIEFVTASEAENVEDRIAYLSELPPVPDEHEISFRLLWHYAESVRHQKYHGLDVISIGVARAG
jgi:NCS2 family nucleobase:cation symporter-2/xanthine permease XanP